MPAVNLKDNELIFEAFMKSKRTIKAFDILDYVIKQQYQLIKNKFGKRLADSANYGWGQSDESCATKIYTNPEPTILQSSWDPADKTGDSIQAEFLENNE